MNPEKLFKVTNKGGGRAEILLYTDIGGWFGITALEFANQIRDLGNVSHVDLRVLSEGGSVIEAVGMYNTIRSHKATWHTHIDGLAASSASWLILATDKIHMAENAQYMIHRASTGAWGTADDLRKMADLAEDIEQTAMVNAYKAKTGLDDKTIMDMLNAETWMNATKAKELGFVDEISETLQMAASVKLSGRYGYTHAPTSLLKDSGGSPVDGGEDDNVTPMLRAAKLREMEVKSYNQNKTQRG